MQRASSQIGRRVLRAEAEMQKRKQLAAQDGGDDLTSTDNTDDEIDELSKQN